MREKRPPFYACIRLLYAITRDEQNRYLFSQQAIRSVIQFTVDRPAGQLEAVKLYIIRWRLLFNLNTRINNFSLYSCLLQHTDRLSGYSPTRNIIYTDVHYHYQQQLQHLEVVSSLSKFISEPLTIYTQTSLQAHTNLCNQKHTLYNQISFTSFTCGLPLLLRLRHLNNFFQSPVVSYQPPVCLRIIQVFTLIFLFIDNNLGWSYSARQRHTRSSVQTKQRAVKFAHV